VTTEECSELTAVLFLENMFLTFPKNRLILEGLAPSLLVESASVIVCENSYFEVSLSGRSRLLSNALLVSLLWKYLDSLGGEDVPLSVVALSSAASS